MHVARQVKTGRTWRRMRWACLLLCLGAAGCLPGPPMLRAPELVQWGEARDGLQAGMALTKLGGAKDRIDAVLVIRSVADAPFEGPDPSTVWHWSNSIHAYSSYRDPLERRRPPQMPSRNNRLTRTWEVGDVWTTNVTIDLDDWRPKYDAHGPAFLQYHWTPLQPDAPPLASPLVRFEVTRIAM